MYMRMQPCEAAVPTVLGAGVLRMPMPGADVPIRVPADSRAGEPGRGRRPTGCRQSSSVAPFGDDPVATERGRVRGHADRDHEAAHEVRGVPELELREPRFTIRMGPKLRRVSAGACRLISSRMGERSVRTSALVIFRRITHCRTVRPQTAFVITGFRLLR